MNTRAVPFLPAAGASVVLGLMVATTPLSPIPRGIALTGVVGAWVAAVAFRRADVRAHASVVAAIAAVTAAGQVEGGRVYGPAVGLFLLGCLVSMRAARRAPELADPKTAPELPPLGRWKAIARPLIAMVLTGTLAAATLILGLPGLAARIERRVTSMFGLDGEQATAFSTTMVLGATRGMLQSDAIVMRIDGAYPEYLRGAVYDRYDGKYWLMSNGRAERALSAKADPGNATMRITLVRGTPNGPDMRWFLPPGACDLGVGSGRVEVDVFGVARRGKEDEPATITLRTQGCKTAGPEVTPPSKADLDVRNDVRAQLTPIAIAWASPFPTRRERLEEIKRQLGRFEYSLSVPRDGDKDPVVDFLTVHRAGHCEMFAAAMVLLARTIGIPARVVGGYRVSEVNPLTGRAIVRDRNAHAWVEAWVDGAWRGFDPTPASEAFAHRAGALDNIGDVLSAAVDRAGTAISHLTTFGVVSVLGAMIAVLSAIRWIGGRLRARRGRRSGGAVRPPLPCFDALSVALARAGYERDGAEPIETFARRLAESSAPWAKEAASALLAYADLRYGGIGDEAAIVHAVDRAALAVRPAA